MPEEDADDGCGGRAKTGSLVRLRGGGKGIYEHIPTQPLSAITNT